MAPLFDLESIFGGYNYLFLVFAKDTHAERHELLPKTQCQYFFIIYKNTGCLGLFGSQGRLKGVCLTKTEPYGYRLLITQYI